MTPRLNRNNAIRANFGNSISYAQNKDGFPQKVQMSLNRVSTLSVLAQDVTKTDTDRSNYSVEFMRSQNYISAIGKKTFNTVTLLVSAGNGITIESEVGTFSINSVDLQSTTDGIG